MNQKKEDLVVELGGTERMKEALRFINEQKRLGYKRVEVTEEIAKKREELLKSCQGQRLKKEFKFLGITITE